MVRITKTKVGELTVEVILTPNENVEFINADSIATVDAGNAEDVIVKAATGYIYEVLAMQLHVPAPSGGSSGTHSYYVFSESEYIPVLEGISVFSSIVSYKFGYWHTADSSESPVDETTQCLVLKGLRIDAINGIIIRYSNNTDVGQTDIRSRRLWVRKIKVS